MWESNRTNLCICSVNCFYYLIFNFILTSYFIITEHHIFLHISLCCTVLYYWWLMQPCNLERILVVNNMIASFKTTRAVSLWLAGVSRILAWVRGAHLMSVVTNFVYIWKNIAEVHFICFFFFSFLFLCDSVGERGLEADGRPPAFSYLSTAPHHSQSHTHFSLNYIMPSHLVSRLTLWSNNRLLTQDSQFTRQAPAPIY